MMFIWFVKELVSFYHEYADTHQKRVVVCFFRENSNSLINLEWFDCSVLDLWRIVEVPPLFITHYYPQALVLTRVSSLLMSRSQKISVFITLLTFNMCGWLTSATFQPLEIISKLYNLSHLQPFTVQHDVKCFLRLTCDGNKNVEYKTRTRI